MQNRQLTLKITADSKEAEASIRRLAKASENLNNKSNTNGSNKFFSGGIDIAAIKRQFAEIEQLSARQRKVVETGYRAELKIAQESARQQTAVKKGEYQQFIIAEKGKQNAAALSARKQIQEANNAARASESAKKREYQEFVRLEKEKAKAANQSSRGRLGVGGAAFAGGAIGGFVGSAISSVTSAAVGGASALLDYSSRLEQVKISFQTLTGSAQTTNTLLKEIQDFAKTTPFEFGELATLSQKLLGARVEATKVVPLIRDIGNAVSAVGGSQEDLNGTVRAFTQIISLGKVSAEEMNQLSERNINGFQILATQLGKTTAEVKKMAEAGVISSDVFIQAFQQFSQANFGDAMEKQSNTFAGAMSNIKDALFIAASTYFAPLYESISQIAVKTSKELEGADFSKAVGILAKNFASGLIDAITTELKTEWAAYSWDDFFSAANASSNFGAEFSEKLFGGWSLWDELITGGVKPAKMTAQVKKFSADLSKSIDFNGVKYKFDTVTNTMQRVSAEVKKTPSLAAQLKAKEAEEETKKLESVIGGLGLRIKFFGDETEVAATKQALLSQGIVNFNSAQAQTALAYAGTLDNLKKIHELEELDKKDGEERLKRFTDFREELEKIREESDFDMRFANPSELDKFNEKINQTGLEFNGLTFEIEQTRDALKSLAFIKGIRETGDITEGFLTSLRSSVDALNTTKTTPFQDEMRELLKGINLFTAAGEKLDNDGIAKNIETRILDFQRELAILNDSAANAIGDPATIKANLSSKTEKIINDWYADFAIFMRGIRQKVEVDGNIDFTAFFEGKEGNKATIEEIIKLFERFNTSLKLSNAGTFKETVSGLDEEIAALNRELAGGIELSRADALAKQLQTEAYKDFTPEMIAVANAKAKEIDGLRASIEAQEEYRQQFEKTAGIFEDALTNIVEGNFKGLFKSILDQMKQFLIRAAAEWLASKFFKLISGTGGGASGGSSSGGGIFGVIKNLVGGLFGGRTGGGGSANRSSGGSDISSLISGLGGFGSGSTAGQPRGVLGNVLGSYGIGGSGGSARSSGIGLAGGIALGGAAANIIGGLIGGRTGGFISGAGSGAALGAQLGSIVPGIGTLIGAGVGAIAGGLLSLFGGDPKRKRDKKENLPALNKGFADAFAQLQQVLADSKALKFEPPSDALTKGNEIYSQIISGFGIKFESKKYRKEAANLIQANKTRADILMNELRESVKFAENAGLNDKALVPVFASGGFIKQYGDFKRRNGFLRGKWTGRDTLPSMLADGEMVLNPVQQQRVRSAAGFDAFKHAQIPNYADGVSFATSPNVSIGHRAINVTIVVEGEIDRARIKNVLVDGLTEPDVAVSIAKSNAQGVAYGGLRNNA